jgi:transposase
LGPFKDAIDGMLRQNLDSHPKQQQSAKRIWERLVDERGADVSYSTVRDYVKVRARQIDEAAGRRAEVFIPQEHAPGAEAEVDFGMVWVVLDGVRTKCHMFAFRLSHSGRAVHRIYPTEAQEAFLEGHVDAFEELGGIPVKHIRYDNLTDAVQKVLFGQGRARIENPRWMLFRSHYGFDAFYCRPGIEGAHEKGGVEGEVGRFRRRWLSPEPVIDSLAELNAMMPVWDARDEDRHINNRIRTVAEGFAAEQPLLAPLPFERFDPGLVLHPRVDRSSLITVRQAKYSVPTHLIGRKVRVSLRASELVVFDGRAEITRHERVTTRYGQSVNLDHYLEVLKTKPGALPGSTALAHARASGVFTMAHDASDNTPTQLPADRDGDRPSWAAICRTPICCIRSIMISSRSTNERTRDRPA